MDTPQEKTLFTSSALEGRILENRYQIEKLIGEGAMGYVYRGIQLRLRRTVAIKVPRPDLTGRPEYLARFEREALAMARCVHENIVAVYDVFVARNPDEITYLAMEYIEGVDLNFYLISEQDHLTVSDVLDILRQLARGIDAAHAAGIIHRDIKPSNMVIVTQPRRIAKIMDFGIARGDVDDVYRTLEGVTMGTPAFMAPEQVRGEDIGPKSDVYSFAMSLYKIFARDLPYDAGTTASMLFHQMNRKPIPLRWRNPSWPRTLETAIMNAISKDPADRPDSAGDLVNQISTALAPLAGQPFAPFFAKLRAGSPPALPGGLAGLQKSHLAGAAAILILIVSWIGVQAMRQRPAVISPPPSSTAVHETPPPELPRPTPSPAAPEPANVPPPVIPETTPAPVVVISDPTATAKRPEVSNILPQPALTPEVLATPLPALTPRPPISWSDPALWKPQLEGSARILELKTLDRIIVEEIRRPIFRGQIRKAMDVFNEVDPVVRDEFFTVIQNWSETHTDLTLIYIRESEKIDGERAELNIRTGLTGRPRLAGPQSPAETLVPTFNTRIYLLKKQGGWFLVDWPSFAK
ncbi:MAG TPA: protein kinase [Candidatus Sumerlaeota bacterium]|nr:protein kinase [Candidatus Sumerlaeota bacterium]